MARHALVIGASLESQPTGSTCEELDVARMARMLHEREFDVEPLCGAAATRDGIIDAYGRLIERVEGQDDAAVVYFTGHGGMATPAEGARQRGPLKPERFIARKAELLEPGGLVLTQVPNLLGYGGQLLRLSRPDVYR